MKRHGLSTSCAIAALIATAATAEVPVSTSGPYSVSVDGLDAFDCNGAIKWEQLPDGASGLSSQDDQCYPFVSEVADDFLGDGDGLIGLGWWGVYWGGTPIPPDQFRVRIYAETFFGAGPGEVVYDETTADYNETVGDPYGYCSNFRDSFSKMDGQTYFVSVQAVFCFPPQWGLATGAGNGRQGYFRSEFFGFPEFVTNDTAFGFPYESAFLLYNESTVETQDGSWSRIRKLYR